MTWMATLVRIGRGIFFVLLLFWVLVSGCQEQIDIWRQGGQSPFWHTMTAAD